MATISSGPVTTLPRATKARGFRHISGSPEELRTGRNCGVYAASLAGTEHAVRTREFIVLRTARAISTAPNTGTA